MFTLETNLFFWTVVSFGILVFLLYRIALPPLLKLLEDRRKTIALSLKIAEENKLQHDKLLQEYQKKIKEAGQKAEEFLVTSRSEARDLQNQLIEKAKQDAALIVQHANEEIERQKIKAINIIKQQTAEIVIGAANKIIEKELRPEDHLKLIEESLEELERKA